MTPRDSKVDETRANRMFYWAGMVASLTGVAAISSAVQSAWFLFVASTLVVLGYHISIRLRADGKNLRIVETAVIGICLATYARLFATGQTVPLLSPGLALTHKELSLAVMLVWAEIVRSFSLVSDDSLLFSSVPSLALIGVVATTNPDGYTLFYFSLWLCASITMFIESGKSLAERRRASSAIRAISMGTFLGVGSILTGIVLGPFLQQAATSMFINLAPDVYANRRGADIPGESEINTLEISEGPVRLSSRPVLRVDAPPDLPTNAYWRCRVWDDYTGRKWKSDANLNPVQQDRISRRKKVFTSENLSILLNRKTTRKVVQHVMLEATQDSYLPALSEPAQFTIYADVADLQADDSNAWRVSRDPGLSIRQYTVTSEIPNPSPEQLKAASQDYQEISQMYPLTVERPIVSERVIQLAQNETRYFSNAYDKVLALRRFLTRNCVYDLQTPPIPASKDNDPVDYFLWTSRRGYCDLFATALTTMVRSVGIPARMATGYIQGEYDQTEKRWVVRDKDRHAWVEVYFPKYGWIPFEATPATGVEEPGYWQAVWTELKLTLGDANPRILFLLAALMAGFIGLRYIVLPEGGKSRNRGTQSEREDIRQARRMWRSMARILRTRGIVVPESATPLELSEHAAETLMDVPDARHALQRAAMLISRILYSGGEYSGDTLDRLAAEMAALRAGLKGVRPRFGNLKDLRREN